VALRALWGLPQDGEVFELMPELTRRYAAALGAHLEDAELPAK